MFCFFRKNRKLKSIADSIGIDVYSQIFAATEARKTILNHPTDLAFFAGYLEAIVASTFERRFEKIDEKELNFQIKHICDGIAIGRIWDLYQRGSSLGKLSMFGCEKKFMETREAYITGKTDGIRDAEAPYPKALLKHLTKDAA